jgi:signal transduction histidine kinase/CheY-like chemotaxis protein
MSTISADPLRSPDENAVTRFVHERFVGMFLSQNRRAQLGLLVAASLLAFVWHDAAPGPAPLAWFVAVMLVSVLRYAGTERFLHAASADAVTARVAAVLFVNGVLMALPLLAFGLLTPLQRAATSIILLGAATASIATTAGYRAIFLAFALPMLVPLGLAWMLAPQGVDEARGAAWGIGTLVWLYLLFLLSISRQAHAVFEESCRFRYGEQESNRELTRALERLNEASRAKTHFLAAASHDLRQPFHSLNVLVAALQLRPLDERSREIAGLLDAVNQSMSRQLDGLLDISRLDAGTVQPTLAPLRLDEFIAAHHAALAPLARERGLQLALDAPAGIGVVSDAALLLRVVSNLTDNALKFTPAGGTITLSLRRDGNEAVLSVADSGIGIAAAEHERVFREFYQVSNVERDRSKGLGLGLSIVQRLCALLGVTLQLDSQPSRGTTVTLRLPVADASAVPTRAAAPAMRAALPPGLVVLVIDDEAAVRASMQLLLDEFGCTVHLADSSDDARRIAAAGRIDVVLSDFRLRDGDSGIVALRAVRHLHPQVRAALVTGDTAPSRLRDAQWAGVPLLHKPVQLEELLRVLQPSAP